MDLSFRHDLWWSRLADAPTDVGRVRQLVMRPEHDARLIQQRLELTPAAGIVGDRWSSDPDRKQGTQISLIRRAVLRSFARDDAHAAESGDNLEVDLDLSEANLPVGTRLEIGSAVLEVSEEPHMPCAKLHERFGKRAVQRVARANRRGLRGRGVLCSVVQAGEISVGDTILVKRP
ncbi:MAG: hypothetical protein ACI8QC_002054 [Planctomycetota bacterium]|jgi:hypothetical protein